jgi:pimeloyl-ACP methyl ester carboxylesterase
MTARPSRILGAMVLAAALVAATVALVLARPWRADDPAPPSGASTERLVAVNGHRLNLICAGTGSPTVVYDAGLGDSSPSWERVLDRSSADVRRCAYDRLGNGGSDPAAGPRSVLDATADLQGLLTAAGERPPYVLVSHSIAGLVHRYYANQHPDEVAGLVMVDTAPDDWDLHNGITVFRSGGESLDVAAAAAALRATDDLGRRPVVVVEAARTSEISQAADFPAYWRAAQRALAGRSADSVLVVAGNSNHNVPASQPDLVVAAVAMVTEAVQRGTGLTDCGSSTLPARGGVCQPPVT